MILIKQNINSGTTTMIVWSFQQFEITSRGNLILKIENKDFSHSKGDPV